jgi:signal peptidase II
VTRAEAWRRALAVSAVVVAADQGAKAIVRGALAPGGHADLPLGFAIARTTNRGLAFGALADGRALVIAVTLAALALVVAWFVRNPARPWMWLGTGLLIGGALGNLADRVRVDAVTDFIDPPLWPAFNVADVAITAGAIVLVLISLAAPAADRRTED